MEERLEVLKSHPNGGLESRPRLWRATVKFAAPFIPIHAVGHYNFW